MGYKITWKQSPNFWTNRSQQPIIALVGHRMVGYLPGTDTTFLNPANQVSTHFGIGYRSAGGPVEISQYVDLSDTAWGNGNYDPSGGWTLIKKRADGTVINPNYYTVSVEHEDGGPNSGIVTEPVLQTSLWLYTILLSGNADLIRSVGIKMREDYTATQLSKIQIGTETLIDHNRISGTKKPYCWRPYKLDTQAFLPGWQPRLLDYLRSGTSMAIDDTLALLATEIDALQAERDAAIAEAAALTTENLALEANLADAETDLQIAKSVAGEIKVLAEEILAL